MTDPIMALAMTGATTIVAAMATGAWDSARRRIAAVFHRGGDVPAVEAQLDGDADLVLRDDDPDGARADLVRPWTRRLAALLRDHPEAVAELRAAVDQLATELPDAGRHWAQHIVAYPGGTAFGAQGPGSSVHVHHHRPPSSDG